MGFFFGHLFSMHDLPKEITQDVTTIEVEDDELMGMGPQGSKTFNYNAPEISGGLETFIKTTIRENNLQEAFAVFDLAAVKHRFHTWKKDMPRVHPCYAVKCNPDLRMLRLLAEYGASFDCASQGELELVSSIGVNLSHDVIFANPCKLPSHIQFAKKAGCRLTTFDTESELRKIHELFPAMDLVIRIRADDPSAVCPLGNKYGVEHEDIIPLLTLAKDLGLHVVGVSFHVGSGATNPEAFKVAIQSARWTWDEATKLGHKLRLLDLGGGWTGFADMDGTKLGPVAQVVNQALDTYFPPHPHFKVTAEPGRYLAEAVVTIAVNVFGIRPRKAVENGETKTQMDYWISDGVYGTFNCVMYDHAHPQPAPLLMTPPELESRTVHQSTIFGPTCDGLDKLPDTFDLPLLNNGDWLVFPYMGAYTVAAGSDFNGYKILEMKRFYVWSEAKTA